MAEKNQRKLNRMNTAAAAAKLGDAIADVIAGVNAGGGGAPLLAAFNLAVADITALRTQVAALVADVTADKATLATLATKLNADAGVTDTNYAAPAAQTSVAPAAITTAVVGGLTGAGIKDLESR